MPELVELDTSRLQFGQALPWDLYDARGRLLLCAGSAIESNGALERLMNRALRIQVDRVALEKSPLDLTPAAPPPPPRTAASLITDVRSALGPLCAAPDAAPDFRAALIDLVEQVLEAVEMNRDLALAMIMMRRDGSYACRHAVDAAIICAVIGPELGLDMERVRSIVAAALTMNIGMLELQDELHDQRSALSPDQSADVRRHTLLAVQRLRQLGIDDPVWLDAVLNHHEASDGNGYPRGLNEAQISIEAQLLALADVYCARVSPRGYRPALRPNVVLRGILLNEGLPTGGSLGPLFIKAIGVYPPGTLVRLRNGDLAAVMHRGEKATEPQVYAFTDGRNRPLTPAVRRDTSQPGAAIAEVLDWSQADRPISVLAVWGVDGDSAL